MTDLLPTATLADLAREAAQVLPDNAHGYFAATARDGYTHRRNEQAWDSWEFRPRVLVDVSTVRNRTAFLGEPCLPFGIAPMAAQRLAHPEGELATASAAADAGAIMVVSISSSIALEELTQIPGPGVWLQLYLFPDRERNMRIVRRAEDAGAKALVITVDVPVPESTHRIPPGGVVFPADLTFPMHDGPPEVHSALTWSDIEWLRHRTELPILLKGVTHPSDAELAVGVGCAAVVVSNHGGRQLDGVSPTADLLPEIVAAVGSHVEVYVDGGIRRGADVLRALGLGATGVLVGRPVLWGLAAGGQAGVRRVLDVLAHELAVDAALAGVNDLRQVPRDLIRRRID